MCCSEFEYKHHIAVKLKNMGVFTSTASHLKTEHILPMPPGSQFLQLPMIKDHNVDGGMEEVREWTDGEMSVGLNLEYYQSNFLIVGG